MKKIFLLIGIFLISQKMFAQNNEFKTLPDPKNESVNMLVGQISFANIAQDPTCIWMANNYAKYTPDSMVIKRLQDVIKAYNFVVFIGTWCEDTQNLLPSFYKVCKLINLDNSQLEMYGMDRDKKALYMEDKLYKIENLPTFIIYKNHREIGRIVETAKNSIEKNILSLVESDIANWKE